MHTLILFVGLFLSNAYLSAQKDGPVSSAVSDSELHEDVIKFVELTGARQRILDGADKSTAVGEDSIRKNFPNYDPAFVPEWGRRMRARFNAQDYVDVFIRVYQAHFSHDEIKELIEAQRSFNRGVAPTLSQHLKEKTAEIGIAVQSEILGGCSQVGAKLGGEIGQDLQKEHPEWVNSPKAAESK